jgi:hypothetical protein
MDGSSSGNASPTFVCPVRCRSVWEKLRPGVAEHSLGLAGSREAVIWYWEHGRAVAAAWVSGLG